MPEVQVFPDEPQLTLDIDKPKPKRTEIYFISSEKEARTCNFWVGVYRRGALTPQALMQLKKTGDIMTAAVHEGVNCNEPLVLAETTTNQDSVVYFLAPIQNEKLADSHLWLDKLCEAICEWGPQSPGIYFAPELLGTDLSSKLLAQVLRLLITREKFSTIYLLLGSHGMHSILNSVLKLKSKLHEECAQDIFIYH
jgi:hypothetical protein